MSLREESVFIPSEEQTDIEEVLIDEVVIDEVKKVEETKVPEPVKVKEIKIDDDELPDFTDKSLQEVFLYIVKKHVEEKKDTKKYYKKIGINLSKQVVEIINKILDKTPKLLSEIEKSVSEVIKDNKIDTNDIPEFIIIVQILYERLYNLKDIVLDANKLGETCATILKFIVHTLVEERKIIIEEEKKIVFLKQFDKLIDSCVSLLNFKSALKPQACCTIM